MMIICKYVQYDDGCVQYVDDRNRVGMIIGGL